MRLVDLLAQNQGKKVYLDCNPEKNGPVTLRVENFRIQVYKYGWLCLIYGDWELQFLSSEVNVFMPLKSKFAKRVEKLLKRLPRKYEAYWLHEGFTWSNQERLLKIRVS